jgi:hypothetical protein
MAVRNLPMLENEQEAIRRKAALAKQLDNRCAQELKWANRNHYGSVTAMCLALGCSVLAAILGIFFNVSAKIVGGLGLLPPLIAFVATNLKFEAKNSWHARLYDGLSSLRSRLLYQQPGVPTLDQVAIIAKGRDDLEIKMQAEWDRTLLLNWTSVANHGKSQHIDVSNEVTK